MSNSKNNKAVAYIRVSTKKQEDQGKSLKTQEKAAKDYANKNNLTLDKLFIEAKSAFKVPFEHHNIEETIYKKMDIETEGVTNQLEEMLKYVIKNNIKHIIIHSKDRLSRRLEIALALDSLFIKHNINVHYTKAAEDVKSENDSINKFLKIVFASIAELESNLISERVKDGLKQKARTGYWPGGKAPYGYKYEEKSFLIPQIEKIEYVQKIFNFYTSYGYSYKKIADEMNKIYNSGDWTKSKVESIIKNEVYSGYIVWNRRSKTDYDNKKIIKSTPTNDISVIPFNQWENSLKLRENKANSSKYYHTPFLLRDKLECGKCSTLMKSKNYGKDRKGNQRDNVYRCISNNKNKKSKNSCNLIIKQTTIEAKFIDEFCELLSQTNMDKLWKLYCDRVCTEKESYTSKLDRKKDELDIKNTLLNKSTDVILTEKDSMIKNTLEYEHINLLLEITELETEIKELENIDSKYFKSQSDFQECLGTFLKYHFKDLDQHRKRILIDILIDKIIVKQFNGELTIKIMVNTKI